MRRGNGERASLKYLSPLIKYLGRNKALLLVSIIFAIIGTLFTIIGPRFVSKIADLITAGFTGDIDLKAVVRIGTLMIVMYSLAWIFSFFQHFAMNSVTQRTAYGLRKDICRKINILPLKYFDNHLIGDILSRIVNDIDTIAMAMNQSVGNLFSSGTQFIVF